MPVQAANPFGAFLEGRQARQQEQYGQTRNALAQMELENAPQEMQQRNRLADLQIQGLERQYSQDQINQALQQTAAAASRLAQSSNPRAEAGVHSEFMAKLREQNPEIDQYDDEQFRQYMGWIAGEAQAKLGVGPAAPIQSQNVGGMTVLTQDGKYLNAMAPKGADESYTLGPGQQRWENGKMVASVPATPAQPKDERLVQIADEKGNPKWVRESDAEGKQAYVARDKPAAADLKYQREIKSKQPRLKAARRRVDRLSEAILGAPEVKDGQGRVIKPAVKGIAQNALFDGGPVDQYALAWTKQGQDVSQSKAALLSELTALTRVPGIGSQSDLETRLASLPFPSAEFDPEINAKAVAEIQAFVADLEDAYGVVEGEFQNAEVQSLLDKYAPIK